MPPTKLLEGPWPPAPPPIAPPMRVAVPGDPELPNFGVFLYLYTLWRRTITVGRATRACEWGVFLGVSHASIPVGRGLSAPPSIFGFPFYLCYTLWCRTTKFDVITHMGRGLFCLGSDTLLSRGSPSAPQFWGSLFMATPFNVVRPRSAR